MRHLKRLRDWGGAGRNQRRLSLGALTSVVVLALVVACAGAAADRNPKSRSSRKKKQAEPYALLVGTVFDENGRLVRGGQVRVRQKAGKRHWEAATDTRGEFAVRLPAGSAVYLVEATAPGFTRDTKEVSFVADERQDIAMHIARQGK